MGLGFGITFRHGENVIEKFFSYLKEKQQNRDGKKFISIKAKNVATEETRELEIELDFCVMQYQAYGAYMAILFSKFKMEVYDTYVIDIGHGTWIKLPIIDNAADINLSDSQTEGIYTITKNISNIIFETSGQKFKIPEQRIMERLPSKNYKIEVPGKGLYDFSTLIESEAKNMAARIVEFVTSDIATMSAKGQTVEYFTVIGGGAHLLFDEIKANISTYFGWSKEVADQRIINPASLGIDARYINCVGFMLLARDQIATELNQDVDPNFNIKNIVTDFSIEETEDNTHEKPENKGPDQTDAPKND